MDAEFLLREVVRLDDLYRTEHQTAKVGIRLPRELQQTDR
jgi:hypothetical protein